MNNTYTRTVGHRNLDFANTSSLVNTLLPHYVADWIIDEYARQDVEAERISAEASSLNESHVYGGNDLLEGRLAPSLAFGTNDE